MIIDLSSIGTTPKAVGARFGPDEIDLEDDGKLSGTALFVGEMFRDGQKAHVRGTIAADVSLDCTRCLEPVGRHFEIPFDDIFLDASEEKLAENAEVEPAGMDESLVIDGTIDLAEVVREQILLALPEMIFCIETCKGLCAKCGGNLNLIDCKCNDDEIDPRWAALKNLK